jgi:hypothetical protein
MQRDILQRGDRRAAESSSPLHRGGDTGTMRRIQGENERKSTEHAGD